MPKNILYGFANDDWAGNQVDRKSNSGYIFKYSRNEGLITWKIKNKNCVALVWRTGRREVGNKLFIY